MQFHYLPQRISDQAGQALGASLAESFQGLEFTSPMHLKDTITEHSAIHGLGLRVTQVGGTLLVQTEAGIILHIKPMD